MTPENSSVTADAGGISRRDLLVGGGLTIALTLAPGRRALAQHHGQGQAYWSQQAAAVGLKSTGPSTFLRIGTDNLVTIVCKHLDMGQGIASGLATLAAEELDADWSQMRVAFAPANSDVYKNLLLPFQGQITGGSTSMSQSYFQMREAGARARAMLVQTAAGAWKVPASEIRVDKGVLSHPGSGNSARFGELADAAGKLPPPELAALKPDAAFKFIGKSGVTPRLDVPGKSNATLAYSIDHDEPNLTVCVMVRPHRFGARVKSVDDTEARKTSGVVDIKTLPGGVAVYARSTYPAIKASRKLKVEWDDTNAELRSTAQIEAAYRSAMASGPGTLLARRGDFQRASKQAGSRMLEAEFVIPYAAHAPMETLNSTMSWDGKRVKVTHASQTPTMDVSEIAKVFGIKETDVDVTTLYAGGSFGRRGPDVVTEAAEAAKALGVNRPVKLMWTREDDIKGGLYRPMTIHRLKAVMVGKRLLAWRNDIGGEHPFGLPLLGADGKPAEFPVEAFAAGSVDMPYDVANFECVAHPMKAKVTVATMRAVAAAHTGYAVEVFLDHLLAESGQDAVEGRLALLQGETNQRMRRVLQTAATMAGWRGGRARNGRAMGVAAVKSFGTWVAEVAEVSIDAHGLPRVHRVWAAVDCGRVVNPDIVRQQVEGAIVYGLSTALHSEITLENGVVQESNFGNYRALRMDAAPEVFVRIIDAKDDPMGIGEPGLPPIAPAVANALFRLGYKRPTRMPFGRRVLA
jgi:isoquinoline 1-oxidoreductase subunit beta